MLDYAGNQLEISEKKILLPPGVNESQITRAGVLLVSADGKEALIMNRDNKNNYGIPGGDREKKISIHRIWAETFENTAFRELEEETNGLVRLNLTKLSNNGFTDMNLFLGFDREGLTYDYYATIIARVPSNFSRSSYSTNEGTVSWQNVELLSQTMFRVYNSNLLNFLSEKGVVDIDEP